MLKKAPRTVLKSQMKKKSDIRIGKNADIMGTGEDAQIKVVFAVPFRKHGPCALGISQVEACASRLAFSQRRSQDQLLEKCSDAPEMTYNYENEIQLNLLLVLHRLAEESRVKAFEEKTATIKVHHLKAVSKKLLKSTRG